jgi:hypothetical protein
MFYLMSKVKHLLCSASGPHQSAAIRINFFQYSLSKIRAAE